MSAIALVIILLSGFVSADLNPKTKYRLSKSSGWNTYFLAAKSSLIPASIALIITGAICWVFSVKYNHDNERYIVLSWCLLSLCIAFLGKYRYFFDKESANLAIQESISYLAKRNEFEHFLYQAASHRKTVQASLKNNKVYIGLVANTFQMSDDFNDTEYFSIFPIFSGYREKDTQSLKITTYYDEVYTIEDTKPEDFKIIIPRSEIVSLSYFDIDYYSKFTKKELNASQS